MTPLEDPFQAFTLVYGFAAAEKCPIHNDINTEISMKSSHLAGATSSCLAFLLEKWWLIHYQYQSFFFFLWVNWLITWALMHTEYIQYLSPPNLSVCRCYCSGECWTFKRDWIEGIGAVQWGMREGINKRRRGRNKIILRWKRRRRHSEKCAGGRDVTRDEGGVWARKWSYSLSKCKIERLGLFPIPPATINQ